MAEEKAVSNQAIRRTKSIKIAKINRIKIKNITLTEAEEKTRSRRTNTHAIVAQKEKIVIVQESGKSTEIKNEIKNHSR